MFRYHFVDDVEIQESEANVAIITPYESSLSFARQEIHLKSPSLTMKSVIRSLCAEGVVVEQYLHDNSESCSPELQLMLQLKLNQFEAKGLLVKELLGEQGLAMSLHPLRHGNRQITLPQDVFTVKLSNYLSIVPQYDSLELCTPISTSRLKVFDDRLYKLITYLTTPRTPEDIQGVLPSDLHDQYVDVIVLLLQSSVAGCCDSNGNADVDLELLKFGWNKEDLLFHFKTRRDSVKFEYEESGHGNQEHCPPPVHHIKLPIKRIKLSSPRPLQQSAQRGFFDVVDQRKTIRAFGLEPVHIHQISMLLWYSLRTKRELTIDPSLPRAYQGSQKPSASAGSLHPIELYLCVKRCIGLGDGLYHYDSLSHQLEMISELNIDCLKMLNLSKVTTCSSPQHQSVSIGKGQEPDVLMIMAARYERSSYLHSRSGLAYALILKDAGSLYQQLYLVSTALGLAPCGLSFGSQELFEKASGIAAQSQCSVGEFMIGTVG